MPLSIDMEKTGVNIKRCVRASGYSIREIMEITGVTVEQTIYKWYRGESIPSLETQLVLCMLFDIPITGLLVLKDNVPAFADQLPFSEKFSEKQRHRLLAYFQAIELAS